MSAVVVLGATSRMAQATCHAFASEGRDLVLLGRDLEALDAIAADLHVRHGVSAWTFPFDAEAFDTHERAVGAVLDKLGEDLEGFVVFLGTLGDQEAARHDAALARQVLDVNLTAVVSATTPVADALEARGAGFLCLVSSVAGDRGRGSNYVYGAAKAGLSAYAAGLRNRLHHAGVQVTTIKPGFVDTKMTHGEEGLFLVASPERAGQAIHRAVRRGRDIAYVPGFWRPVLWALRTIPEALFKRLRL